LPVATSWPARIQDWQTGSSLTRPEPGSPCFSVRFEPNRDVPDFSLQGEWLENREFLVALLSTPGFETKEVFA